MLPALWGEDCSGRRLSVGAVLPRSYTRPKAALSELAYRLEASVTLSGIWGYAGQVETILSDDGITQRIKATYPAGLTGKRFVRLRVTRN